MNRPAVLALLLGVVALRMVSAQLVNQPDAFSAVGVARQSNAKNPRAIRARSVSVNLGLFDRKDAQQILTARDQRPGRYSTRLNLFEDFSLDVLWDRVETDESGATIWSGSIPSSRFGEAVLVVKGSSVFGSIHTGDGRTFRVEPRVDGTHEVLELDLSKYPRVSQPLLQETLQSSNAQAPDTNDDGSVIDVMVLYTPAARAYAGGQAQMATRIQTGIEQTNRGYANSGVIQRVRLVYSAEVGFDETGSFSDDLKALTDPSDGKADQVHALRDQYGADIVSLWVTENQSCGLGYIMAKPSVSF